MSLHEDGYYFCLRHRRVEPHEGCADRDRLGPFATADAAAHALETVAAREARYDAEDAAQDGDARQDEDARQGEADGR